jgi:intein/homing endonuclease
MRILLKKGYQKNLILSIKKKRSFTWKELAKKIDVCEGYLRNELTKEKTTISEGVYKKLCSISGKNLDSFIIKRLDDNWGRSKGGKLRTFREPKLLVKKPSKELAELIGIILGDGNIWQKQGGYYYVRVCGDIVKDRDYLLNYVKPLFEKLFKKKMHSIEHKRCNELFISAGDKDVVYTLKYFGLPSGNKKENDVGIPKWIFKSEEYLKACIRGLIDTDGSICPITGRSYPYIWFTCGINNLRKTFRQAMEKLGFQLSKWNIREGRTPDTYIGNKEQIDKYLRTISFKNKRHLNKLEAPVV